MTGNLVVGSDLGLRGPAAMQLYRIVETDDRVGEPFGDHVFRFMARRHARRVDAVAALLRSYHLRVEKIGRRWQLVPYQNLLVAMSQQQEFGDDVTPFFADPMDCER